MGKLKSNNTGPVRDFTKPYNHEVEQKPQQLQQPQQNQMRMRNILKFLNERAYTECVVKFRIDEKGFRRATLIGKFAAFDNYTGLLITTEDKHYWFPNRGIIESIEFARKK